MQGAGVVKGSLEMEVLVVFCHKGVGEGVPMWEEEVEGEHCFLQDGYWDTSSGRYVTLDGLH